MTTTHEELDFLGLHQPPNDDHHSSSLKPSQSASPPLLDRRRSFSGLMSKINPEIVKSVIASSSTYSKSELSPHLPVFKPLPLSGASNNDKAPENAPFTIIYQGTVSVFDLTQDKANDIIKYAIDQSGSKTDGFVQKSCFNVQNDNNILVQLNDGDLPIKRKKSLQRFFEKRKERLIYVSPYHNAVYHVPHIKSTV